jgi:hypothetical protein
MKATGMVAKTGRNDFHGYDYATEADVVESVRPHMVANGLMLIPHVDTVNQDQHGNTNIIVNYRLYHVSGDFIEFNVAAAGNDKNRNGVGDKGIYKAMTGASKYALLKLFSLATGDDPEKDENHKHAKKQEDDELPPLPKLDTQEKSCEVLLKAVKMCADMARSKDELNDWYREANNKKAIDYLKNNNEALFNEALEYLKKRKSEL